MLEFEAKRKELDNLKLYDVIEIGPDDPRTTRRPKAARQFIITSIEPGLHGGRTKASGILVNGSGIEHRLALSIGRCFGCGDVIYPRLIGHADPDCPALVAFRKKSSKPS